MAISDNLQKRPDQVLLPRFDREREYHSQHRWSQIWVQRPTQSVRFCNSQMAHGCAYDRQHGYIGRNSPIDGDNDHDNDIRVDHQ